MRPCVRRVAPRRAELSAGPRRQESAGGWLGSIAEVWCVHEEARQTASGSSSSV